MKRAADIVREHFQSHPPELVRVVAMVAAAQRDAIACVELKATGGVLTDARMAAMDHIRSIADPIREPDQRGKPFLSYHGEHMIGAFVAGHDAALRAAFHQRETDADAALEWTLIDSNQELSA